MMMAEKRKCVEVNCMFSNNRFWVLTGQKWHTHRKIITPTFHFSILDSFLDVFSEKSKILVSKLRKEVGAEGFDVFPYITHCALDIICGE
jgi:cytochrome P450